MAKRRSGARVAPLLLLLPVWLAACADDGSAIDERARPDGPVDPTLEARAADGFALREDLPLSGTRWQAEAFVAPTGFKAPLFSGLAYTLEFDATDVRVDDGCNGGGGGYAEDGGQLAFSNLSRTAKDCELPADVTGERALVDSLLPSTESYDVRGDRLTLSSFDGSALVFRGQPLAEVANRAGIDPEYEDGEHAPFLVLDDADGGNLANDSIEVPERFVTVHDAGTFAQLWNNAHSRDPAFPVPDVDFDVGSVVVVFSPLRPSLGYDIAVDAIVGGDPRPRVLVTTVVPGAGCAVDTAPSSPYQFVAVPTVLAAPAFEERTVEASCS